MSSWVSGPIVVTWKVTVSPRATEIVDGLKAYPGPASTRTTRGAATVPATNPATPGCVPFVTPTPEPIIPIRPVVGPKPEPIMPPKAGEVPRPRSVAVRAAVATTRATTPTRRTAHVGMAAREGACSWFNVFSSTAVRRGCGLQQAAE